MRSLLFRPCARGGRWRVRIFLVTEASVRNVDGSRCPDFCRRGRFSQCAGKIAGCSRAQIFTSWCIFFPNYGNRQPSRRLLGRFPDTCWGDSRINWISKRTEGIQTVRGMLTGKGWRIFVAPANRSKMVITGSGAFRAAGFGTGRTLSTERG